MEQYISKSALVAEIEKRRDESWLGIYTKEKGIIFDITDEILSFLDTLEVKEIYKQSSTKDLKTAAGNYAFTQSKEDEVLKYYAFIAGAQWQKEQVIEKACGWLADNLLLYWGQIDGNNTDRFIRIFKKAMEE